MKIGVAALALVGVACLAWSHVAIAQSSNIAQLATQPGERILAQYLTSKNVAELVATAEKGDLAATYLLFVHYDRGDVNRQAADRWMAKLASTNTPAGRYAVALALYRPGVRNSGQKGVEIVDGAALPVSEQQAQIVELEAIAPQFPKAFALLARIYSDGVWAPTDAAKAAQYLKQGALAGAASATLGLAELTARDGGALVDIAQMADAAAAAGEPDGHVLGCAVYLEMGKSVEALKRCRAAADFGSSWAQLTAGELLTREPEQIAAALKYLSTAARAKDTTIADAASLILASIQLNAGGVAEATITLETAALRNARAAWLLGRIHMDQRQDIAEAEKWLAKALEMQSVDGPAVAFDLARAIRARQGDWTPLLKRAADGGHAQAAMALALEIATVSPLEAKTYATTAAADPAFKDRAASLIAYLDRSGR